MHAVIINAETREQVEAARELFAEYARSIETVAGCSLRHQGFEDELADLPGCYAAPRGRLYLALDNGCAVGCAALRPLPSLGEDVGEVKRMYVRPHARGRGLGDLLIRRLLQDARAAGYHTLKLDTSTSMLAAQRVYARAGFVPCVRYNDDPMEDTLWFEVRL